VLQGRVHNLLSQNAGQFGRIQRVHKFRVLEERHSIRGHGRDGLRRLAAQPEQQRPKEGMVEKQPSPRFLNADLAWVWCVI
jgi:hypothetical protein